MNNNAIVLKKKERLFITIAVIVWVRREQRKGEENF